MGKPGLFADLCDDPAGSTGAKLPKPRAKCKPRESGKFNLRYGKLLGW
ncbi:hypothetical protein A11S_1893 [Micavibrio aeruginosavorus EPB]|uniref:Uncharacterized protein n=1 Tax=Micavibrio aeruginosavorus EPB TaxID=349215 RepID=M4VJM5_9BACT|nr:hypothetical protein A11S_1893 [Micavibrio aeruginosavorus EPB]